MIRRIRDSLLILTLFLVNARAQSNGESASSDGLTDISKAFISLGVLGAACVAAFVIAKVVDHCYDRAALRDDASDISEHTRQLIRARIALSRFKRPAKEKNKSKKKKSKKETQKDAKTFFKLWSQNARTKGRRRTINVEEAKIADQLQVNGFKRHSAHVKFVDELDERGNDNEGAVISIAVPTLTSSGQVSSNGGTKDRPRTPATPHKDSNRVLTISGQIAERENSGRTTPRKETPGRVTSGGASPSRVNSAKKPTSNGRATPSNDKNTKSYSGNGRTTPLKENLKQSPLVAASGRPAVSKDAASKTIPRSSSTSPTKNDTKILPVTQTRPKTAPNSKPQSKVVAVKSAVIKTPSTPKSSSKASPRASSAKPVNTVPPGKASGGPKGAGEVNSSTRNTDSVVVSIDKESDA